MRRSRQSSVNSDDIAPFISSRATMNDVSSVVKLSPADNPEAFVPQAPDGGWGWAIVAASFILNFIIDGFAYSFGVLSPEFASEFNISLGEVSLIGSLFAGICFLTGPIVSALVNIFGCRKSCMAGSIMITVMFVISSQANSFSIMLLSYGILAGFSSGLMYMPAVTSVSHYFLKKRSLATGIATCGSGLGMAVFPPLMEVCLEEYGWRGTLLIIGGIFLQGAVAASLMRGLRSPLMEINDCNVTKTKLTRMEKLKNIIRGKARKRSSEVDDNEMHNFLNSNHSFVSDQQLHSILKLHSYRISGANSTLSVATKSLHHNITNSNSNTNIFTSDGQNLPHMSSIHLDIPRHSRLEDYQRPFYRKDIFYGGSITSLASRSESTAAFKRRRISPNASLQILSLTKIPAAEDMDEAGGDRCYPCTERFHLPKPLLDVLRAMTSPHLFKNWMFMTLVLANVFVMMGLYVPNFFSLGFSTQNGISKEISTYQLSILGITSLLGRLVCGYLSNLPGSSSLAIYACTLILAGLSTVFILPFATTLPLMITYMAIYGFSSAPFIGLISLVLCEVFGLDNLNNAYGLISLVRGIFGSLGSPLMGYIFDETQRYDIMFILAGILCILGGICHLIIFITIKCKPGLAPTNYILIDEAVVPLPLDAIKEETDEYSERETKFDEYHNQNDYNQDNPEVEAEMSNFDSPNYEDLDAAKVEILEVIEEEIDDEFASKENF